MSRSSGVTTVAVSSVPSSASAGLAAGGLLVPHSSSVQSNVVGAPGGPPSAPAHKPCKCKNSKCLKLYCECFSAGVMCSNCNCVGCLNNPAHEQARDEAIDQQLEKNPHAFKPKIASAHMLAKGATPSPAKPKRGWNQGTVDPAAGPDATPLDGQFMKVHNKGCNCKKSFCLKKSVASQRATSNTVEAAASKRIF